MVSDVRPPVPPRPPQSPPSSAMTSHNKPPIPPLPPNFRADEQEARYGSNPHLTDPMLAPRPHRLQPDLPANMAATLDDQYGRGPSPAPPPPPSFPFAPGLGSAAYQQRGPSPLPPQQQQQQQPGFIRPNSTIPPPPPLPPSSAYGFRPGASPAPPPSAPGSNDWNVWALPNSPPPPSFNNNTSLSFPQASTPSLTSPPPHLPTPGLPSSGGGAPYSPPAADSLSASFSALSFSSDPAPHPHPHRQSTAYSFGPARRSPTPPRQTAGPPSLTAPLPSVPALASSLASIQASQDGQAKIGWARDVLSLVDRLHPDPASASPGASAPGPIQITDAELARLVPPAVQIVLQLASAASQQQGGQTPKHVAEALYLRGTLANSGSQPDHVPPNPRAAFRDFEQAARAGHHAAWFRLGRDYETVGDARHAKDCFERGVKFNVEACLYRMGMAHLMGQLGLPANPEVGLPLLHRAATCASVSVPQPAYVYGLLLIDQFAQLTLPSHFFSPLLPPGVSAAEEARKHLERAAYLNFAPAQYKLGHAYEFAQNPFPFDPLLSVQYYSLASQQGEVEADMSLSKWFLCGAEGCFDKDEALALTFAEKAARKGLPAAEFAMGYYAEVGVGGPKDLEGARKWYSRAANHGNTDAPARLSALAKPSPEALSRQEHANITESTLVRKRTQAKQDSDARRQQQQQQQPLPNQPTLSVPGQAPSQGQGGPGGYGGLEVQPLVPRTEAQKIVDLARRNSRLTNNNAPAQRRQESIGFGGPPHPAAAQQQQQRPLSQHQQQGQGQYPHHAASLPPGVVQGDGRRPSGPQQGPQQGGQQGGQPGGQPGRDSSPAGRPFSNAHRYSLADPGSSAPNSPGPSAPGGWPGSPAPSSAASVPPPTGGKPGGPGRVPSASASVVSAPAKVQEIEVDVKPPMKYQTFEEMGFKSAKADDKDCVIM